eukprot:7381024-Karenia_brevis.AAC.1
MSKRNSIVRSKASSNRSSGCRAWSVVISRSSARALGTTSSDCIMRCHGLSMNAMQHILRGQPCGIPHWCLCSVPMWPANEKCNLAASWYRMYVDRM